MTLAWDASSDPTVVGYNLYYGPSSKTYTNLISVGQSTSSVVSNLAAGATYYFAATTINLAGLESIFSTEVVYQVGGAPCVITLTYLAQVYDGTPRPLVSTSPPGVAVMLTYNGLTGAPVFVGNYQVLATVTDSNYVQEGVSGYLGKIHKSGEINAALEAVRKGQLYLCAEAATALAKDYRKKTALASSRLSCREKEVLMGIAEGQSTKEVANNLHVSTKTIETHRQNVMEKLNLHSVAELTKYAIRQGLTCL